MNMTKSYDVVFLGSGPAGYVGAIRAGQLGFKTAVVEETEDLGGVCLNFGCIPTKALLKTAENLWWIQKEAVGFGINVGEVSVNFQQVIKRSRDVVAQLNRGVSGLMKKNKVEVIRGRGRIQDPHLVVVEGVDDKAADEVSFKNLVVATGARPRMLPDLNTKDSRILTAKEALMLQTPPKSLAIIGGGAIGGELGYFFSQFGTKVTLIEALDRVLPLEDPDVSRVVERSFLKNGIAVRKGTAVSSVDVKSGESVRIELSGKDPVVVDAVLVSIGVVGNVENLGLEEQGIECHKGFIKTNEVGQTSVPHIYAVGDVSGPPWLAHVASHEAILAVEHMAGHDVSPINRNAIPACVYCQPQVGSVGLTEVAAKEKGLDIKVGRFPFRASGKALAGGDTDGFVKLVFQEPYGELIGAHLVGHNVTEMMGTFVVMMNGEVTRDELISAIHPHPTLSEAVVEAALDAEGRVLHA